MKSLFIRFRQKPNKHLVEFSISDISDDAIEGALFNSDAGVRHTFAFFSFWPGIINQFGYITVDDIKKYYHGVIHDQD